VLHDGPARTSVANASTQLIEIRKANAVFPRTSCSMIAAFLELADNKAVPLAQSREGLAIARRPSHLIAQEIENLFADKPSIT